MDEKQLVSTVKYVASARPAFMLSEIATYLDEPATPDQISEELRPHLPTLNLGIEKTGDDYRVFRVLPEQPYILNASEEHRVTDYQNDRVFPSGLDTAIARYIAKKTGKDWGDPVVLERLRHAIVAQKDDYWKPTEDRVLRYTKGYSVLGYLAYHFPVYFMQTRHLLAELARDGLLKQKMTLLDLGTGPGVVPLAVADFWENLETARAEVISVERSKEHAEAFEFLVNNYVRPDAHVVLHPPVKSDITDTGSMDLPPKIDLMVFSNVINELSGLSVNERAGLVMDYSRHLAPDGTILIVEPAEEVTSTGLRILSLALKKSGLSVYAPCTYLWGTNCTPNRCWSFTTTPSIKPTMIMQALAACDEPFRYINTDIKYSYVMLRKDGKTRRACTLPDNSRAVRMSRLHLNVGNRITVAGAKMSGELGDKKNHVFRICDGSSEKPVFAVMPAYHATSSNQLLTSAGYGELLLFRNVLVRYSREHDGFNLLVNQATEITSVLS